MSQAEFNEWAKDAGQLRDEMLHVYEKAKATHMQIALKEYEENLNNLFDKLSCIKSAKNIISVIKFFQ